MPHAQVFRAAETKLLGAETMIEPELLTTIAGSGKNFCLVLMWYGSTGKK
jgi:hypothetical protein